MWDNLRLKNLKNFNYNFKRRENRVIYINQGIIGIQALETKFIHYSEIKAITIFVKKILKKNGKLFFNCVPNYAFTKKPLETRMGKGKGSFKEIGIFLKNGRVFLEIMAVNEVTARRVAFEVQKKLNIKTKIITIKL